MSSDSIFALIDQIAANPSRIDKEDLIRFGYSQHGDEFARVLRYAYDPFLRFGVEVIPEPEPQIFNNLEIQWYHWATLDALIARTLVGNEAQRQIAIALGSLTESSRYLLARILKKDLRAGIGDSIINKAIPNLIPEFPYMRCVTESQADLGTFPWSQGVYSQLKADGQFLNVDVHPSMDRCQVTSRKGQLFPIAPFEEILNEARLLGGYRMHGEALISKNGVILSRKDGNGILRKLQHGGALPEGHKIVFHVWDAIPLTCANPGGSCDSPYRVRFGYIKSFLGAGGSNAISVVETKLVYSRTEAQVHLRTVLAQGLEGTILKHPEAVYRDGDNPFQVKFKLEVDVDLKVAGWNPGTGKNKNYFGSIVARTSDDLLEVNIPVSGFKQEEVPLVFTQLEGMVQSGTVMTVKANSVTEPSGKSNTHSLYLPRFVEFRTDKSEADSLESVLRQFADAVRMPE